MKIVLIHKRSTEKERKGKKPIVVTSQQVHNENWKKHKKQTKPAKKHHHTQKENKINKYFFGWHFIFLLCRMLASVPEKLKLKKKKSKIER